MTKSHKLVLERHKKSQISHKKWHSSAKKSQKWETSEKKVTN